MRGQQQQQLTREQAEQMIDAGLATQELTKAIAGQSNPGAFESASEPVHGGPKTIVVVTFAVEDASNSGHRHVELQMARTKAYEAEGQPWRVDRWNTGDAHGAH
jgi:hypothetical protein